MRITFLPTIAIITLALVACNDDGKKSGPEPSKTSTSSGVTSSEPPSATTPTSKAPVAADNTGRNARDDGSTLTPLDQGMSEKDIAITQAVRKAVVAHTGLSVNAQNVKIIAKDGVVTLRGPVESESERSTIVEMARQVPEVQTVVNKLEIAAR